MLASDSSVAVYAGDVQALFKQAFMFFHEGNVTTHLFYTESTQSPPSDP